MDLDSQVAKNNNPLVTIGVSSYNYSRYIEEALNSLLTQTYSNTEIIIIDDCSADDCPQKIEKWIKENNVACTYIKHQTNLGITKTSNEIVRLSKGKYITLFATDDIMLPQRIEQQVKILEAAGEEYGLCYANAETIDEGNNALGYYQNDKNFHFKEGNILSSFLTAELRFATPVSLIRKTVYKKIGMYNERVAVEDFDFFSRLFAVYKVKYCEYPCIKYRIKKYSAIHEKMSENTSERYCHDRIISNHESLKFISDPEIRKFLKQKTQFYLKTLLISQSQYFNKMFLYVLVRGYFTISCNVIMLKLKLMLRHFSSKKA